MKGADKMYVEDLRKERVYNTSRPIIQGEEKGKSFSVNAFSCSSSAEAQPNPVFYKRDTTTT